MTCSMENREDRLLDYISGALDPSETALFKRHLEVCGACREFVAGQKAVWDSLDLFEPAPVSDEFNRRLYARIAERSWGRRVAAAVAAPFRPPLLFRQGVPLVAAAAALAAVAIVWDRPPMKRGAAPHPPALTAQAETIPADQVQRALDDMEMLREFNHLVVSDSAPSKM